MRRADLLRHTILFTLFGVFLPWRKGIEFFDPFLLAAYVCLAFVFTAPEVVDALARPATVDSLMAFSHPPIAPTRADLLRAIRRGCVYGWLCGLAIIALGIVTVNIAVARGGLVHPPVVTLLSLLVWGGLGCILTAAAAAFVAMRTAHAGHAKSRLRTMLLAMLCAVIFVPQFLPFEWQDWIQLQLTTRNLAWNTLAFAPIAAIAAAAAVAWVAGRGSNRDTLAN